MDARQFRYTTELASKYAKLPHIGIHQASSGKSVRKFQLHYLFLEVDSVFRSELERSVTNRTLQFHWQLTTHHSRSVQGSYTISDFTMQQQVSPELLSSFATRRKKTRGAPFGQQPIFTAEIYHQGIL